MSWLVALFARIALLVVWLTTPLVNRAFQGGWLLPLLGLLLLPITTLTYVLVYYLAGSVTGWGWLWVALAVLLDLAANSAPARHVNVKSKVGSSSYLGNVELIALTGSLFHAQTNGLFHIIEELLPKCEEEPLSS